MVVEEPLYNDKADGIDVWACCRLYLDLGGLEPGALKNRKTRIGHEIYYHIASSYLTKWIRWVNYKRKWKKGRYKAIMKSLSWYVRVRGVNMYSVLLRQAYSLDDLASIIVWPIQQQYIYNIIIK